MTVDELIELFDKHDGEYIKFERVTHQLSPRPDLHAFLLLARLVPGTGDIVSGAYHDEIYLEVTPRKLAAAATESDVIDLIRCGVRYSAEHDCLAMFV